MYRLPCACLCAVLIAPSLVRAGDTLLVPALKGEPWTVAHSPDLGALTGSKQQPVDFGIWQAGDGTWQLWSCIRATKQPGHTRLFHRWEGAKLTDADWKPMGIAMQADPKLGESEGGLQAPFVLRPENEYLMYYGDWNRICLAASSDGKQFTRRLDAAGSPAQFVDAESFINCRDPMVIRIGDLWHCYYCVSHPDHHGGIYCRTSKDRSSWSEPRKVARGGECPFVIQRGPQEFFLFQTDRYEAKPISRVSFSTDPLDFGVDDDRRVVTRLSVAAPEVFQSGGEYYIAYLLPTLKGIQISRLQWIPKPGTGSSG